MSKILPVVLAVMSGAPAVSAQMFRGDAAHGGVYRLDSPTEEGRNLVGLQWRFSTGGDVIASPVVAGNVAYVGSGDGKLYALDRLTGSRLWIHDAGSPVHSSPAVADGRVYFATRAGTLVALDAKTGAPRWRIATGPDLPLPWGHESGDYYVASPALAGARVIFAAGDGNVYALNGADGKPVWRVSIGERMRASPAVEGDQVFVASVEGRLHALALKDGGRRWTFETHGVNLRSQEFGFDRRTIQSSPAVSGGTVFVGARDGALYAVDARRGTLVWRHEHGMSWIITSPAVADGVVYDGSSDAAFVQAVSAADGVERWRFKIATQQPVWASPALAGGVLYAGDFGGRLHAIDRATGQELWQFRSGGQILSSPVVSGELVLFGSGDTSVYALRVARDTAVKRAIFGASQGPVALDKGLQDRGYQALDAAQLKVFLDERVADRVPSVLVVLPGEVPEDAFPLMRKYLDAGGKLVWTGLAPAVWPADPKTGKRSMTGMDFDNPGRVFGVDHSRAIFDPRGASATAAGERWGLLGRWRAAWSVAPQGVSETLALDEWGLAAAWVKSYGGAPGTGLVRAPEHDVQMLYLAAEYRPVKRP